MESRADKYSFPVTAFNFDETYDRWLFSLCQAANDMNLFHHLVDVLSDHQSQVDEPQEILRAEFDSVFFHAMAHTYEALATWFKPPKDIQSWVNREKRAVLQILSVTIPEIKSMASEVQSAWESQWKGPFRQIRNLLVSHYPSPDSYSRNKQDTDDYWAEIGAISMEPDMNDLEVGTIFAGTPIRFRHLFVDDFQRSYLDRLFAPKFDEDTAIRAAGFIGDVSVILKDMISQMLIRLLMRSDRAGGRKIRAHEWNGQTDGWKPV